MQCGEQILLVDDDPPVLNIIKTILEHGGYKVITAENGHEGVLQFKNNKIDLVLMDVVMPVLDGIEACRIIRAMSPNARILFLSAHNTDVLIQKGYDLRGVHLLKKPILSATLLETVRATLDTAS